MAKPIRNARRLKFGSRSKWFVNGVEVPGYRRAGELNYGAPDGWFLDLRAAITKEPLKQEPSSLPVIGIISTWHDADIIGASVKHHLSQGLSEIYVLDNDSPDASVDVAVAAGAVIGEVYTTLFYDDDLRIRKQNEIAQRIVEKYGACWVLSLDADEFMHGRDGLTVAEMLNRMPDEVDTVGSHCFDLYPDPSRPYIIGEHPAVSMQRGWWRIEYYCENHHWKHVALRYRGKFDLCQKRGNHMMAAPSMRKVRESAASLAMLHAPYRRREDSERRLAALCGSSDSLSGLHRSVGDDQHTGDQGAIKRWKSLEAVYEGRWRDIIVPHTQFTGCDIRGMWLYPWRQYYPDVMIHEVE